VFKPVLQKKSERHCDRLFAWLLLLSTVLPSFSAQLRKQFDIPLPFLTVAVDSKGNFQEVFLTYGSVHEGWAVADIDDRYVKDTRKLRLDHFYREVPTQAHLLSPFEVEIMNRVCESFCATLLIFDQDLQFRRWDKVSYLDIYLPVFLKGFYWLFTAAKNSRTALPRITDIDTSLYDQSEVKVPRSDARVAIWQKNPDHVIKLRIAAKELTFQIKKWQKKDLNLKKRDPWDDNSAGFVQMYELFFRLYFNIPPGKK
jgi:hypothetical protein